MGTHPVSGLPTQEPEPVRFDLSVFQQEWWLDVVREFPGYRELQVVRGNRVVGRFPFVLSRNRLGLISGQNPYWTHLGGPVVEKELLAAEQAEVIRRLVEQLPRRTSFTFVCDGTSSYSDLVRSAFIDAGFEHSSEITYVRHPEDGNPLNERKRKHRGHFKRAAKDLECVEVSASAFVESFKMNLTAKGKRSYAPLKILSRLIEQAIERKCGCAIAAKAKSADAATTPFDAAIVYIWDDRRCYYWLSTHRMASVEDRIGTPHPDAIKLLLIKAIEQAQAMNKVFDADGVATPGADHLYRRILGFKIEEHRNVFHRSSALGRIYQSSRSKLMQVRSLITGNSRSLGPAWVQASGIALSQFDGPIVQMVGTALPEIVPMNLIEPADPIQRRIKSVLGLAVA